MIIKVKCINDLNVNLTNGKVYVVKEVKQNTYSIINDNGQEIKYKKERFEMAKTRTIKVKCINNEGARLAVGKEYLVTGFDICGDLIVINERGEHKAYKRDRFELVEAKDLTYREMFMLGRAGDEFDNEFKKATFRRDSVRIDKIESTRIERPSDVSTFDEDTLWTLSNAKIRVVIIRAQHGENGKTYDFVDKDKLNRSHLQLLSKFVVCETSQGNNYGRIVDYKLVDITKKEYDSYKKILKIF